jgi:hypothetical protein
MSIRKPTGAIVTLILVAGLATADPCVSGLQPGMRPGPYSFVVSTGNNRGQSQCFICETEDRPAVVIFARTPSEPLGKLAGQVDRAVAEHKAAELRSWITFLSEDQPALDPQLVRWSQKHALRLVPVGTFEDVVGPPSYRLAREADVTVLLFVKRRVVANFAFRAGELTESSITQVIGAIPRIVEKNP